MINIKPLEEYEQSEIESVVRDYLSSDNYEDFCLGCSYISLIKDFKIISELEHFANERVRHNILDSKFLDLYDKVVKESEQELWGGDELYKIFIPKKNKPTYVLYCIKTTLYIMAIKYNTSMDNDDIINIVKLVKHPSYYMLCNKDKYTTKDRVDLNNQYWNEIIKCLFDGNMKLAFNIMQKIIFDNNEIDYRCSIPLWV